MFNHGLKLGGVLIILILVVGSTCAQEDGGILNTQDFQINANTSYRYSKPKFWDSFKYIPKDLGDFGNFITRKDNLDLVGLSLFSTAILVPIDQRLVDASFELGTKLRWNKGTSYGKFLAIELIPHNFGSALYYIGNGGMTLLIGGGFYAFGKPKNDYRAMNTASELAEVLMSVGVLTQAIKRITGRQSPFRARESGDIGGAWSPFPSFKEYGRNTSNYDAVPSGHLATFMATLTVITTNYPEVKWIKPVGYALGGLMCFQMMANEVHWVSDYPIAILIGYVVGRHAAKRRFKIISNDNDNVQKLQTNLGFGTLGGVPVVNFSAVF